MPSTTTRTENGKSKGITHVVTFTPREGFDLINIQGC